MGYYVKFLPKRKSQPNWKIQYISFKKADTQNLRAKKPKREWDIPKVRWQALGFNSFMTLKEAKSRAKQLNAQLHVKRQEMRLKKIADEQAKIQKRYDAVLPEEFVAEFEVRFLRKRDSQTLQGLRKSSRAYTVWRAAQRMIVAIGVEPSEWFFHTDQIYNYFYQQKMSLRYAASILRLANLWGFYFCRKMAHPFLPVPHPRGFERERILEANLEKRGGVSRASKSISPKILERVRSQLNQKNFNWLFLSVWFGLRPKEIELLHDKNCWKVETLANGKQLLWVYQTKLVAIPHEDRWKPIPIIFDEQRFALRIIQSENFKKPLLQTMKRHFGEGVVLYAGRKGFVDLMLSKGQAIENISIWMGHATINRTWRYYKNRRKFHLVGF